MDIYPSDDDEFIEYIEFDDAGLEENLADQLAESTSHDAVPIDNPYLETADFFSDWDEFADDDYYDEVPINPRRQRAVDEDKKTAAKRKRNHGITAQSAQNRQSAKIDISAFQGVVWRSAKHEKSNLTPLHEPGTGEKVALLGNWRDLFENKPPYKIRVKTPGEAKGVNNRDSDSAVRSHRADPARAKQTEITSDDNQPTLTRQDNYAIAGRDLPIAATAFAYKSSPFNDLNGQDSDASNTATPPSETLSTIQTQHSSVSSDVNMVDSTDSGPDVPSSSVSDSPPRDRKRKAAELRDEDSPTSTPKGNGKCKVLRIAPKDKEQSSGGGKVRRSTRLKSVSK